MGVAVRPIAATDREGWFRLWRGYLAFYRAELADGISEHTWTRLLDKDAPVWGLVAVTDGPDPAVVGIVNYVLHANTWTDRPVCYLEDLFVDPERRGAGTGRALIDAVVVLARTHRWHRVYWMTKEDNAAARRLYDKVADATDWVRYDAHM